MVSIVTVQQSAFSDFEALRDAVQDAPSEIVQIDSGKMAGTLTHMSVGSVGISVGDFSRGIRQRGVLSPNRWTFGFITKPAVICHYNMLPDDHFILAPGKELYSSFSGANEYATVLVDPDELFAFIGNEPSAQEAAAWRQPSSLLTTDANAAAARARDFRMLLKALVDHGSTMSAGTAEYYRRCMLELVTKPVIDRDEYQYRGPQLRSATDLVRKVDRYLIEAGARPVQTSELLAEFQVSQRTLHRAFSDVLGLAPGKFLRRKRLGDVHKALLSAGSNTTIEGAARQHGFLHAGRFAGEYRALFGEFPHETLRRSGAFRVHRGISTLLQAGLAILASTPMDDVIRVAGATLLQ